MQIYFLNVLENRSPKSVYLASGQGASRATLLFEEYRGAFVSLLFTHF